MSILRGRLSLACDVCGARHDSELADSTMVRIEASGKGWRYFPGVWVDASAPPDRKGRRGEVGERRFVDVCSGCEPPPQGSVVRDRPCFAQGAS